ncbi:hypothetical protein CF095_16370 [Clostridium botulinum]
MKQMIIALLTTTINRYYEVAANTLFKRAVIKDLTNILDYIEDTPEEKQPITVVLNNDKEITKLKKYIGDLEKSCECMNEIEINLSEKIGILKNENRKLKYTIAELEENRDYRNE